MRTSKKDLKEKAMKIYRYIIRGISTRDIADAEGIPERTIQWLIREGGRILGGDLKLLTKEGVIREMFLAHKERKRQLWSLFSSAKREQTKIAALARLMEEDELCMDLVERFNLLEDIGDLPEVIKKRLGNHDLWK
ncbi:MAG: hypothetical protein HY587_00105 [Candidatus Omnitrophica bacterium]|nr:hypothetical protein [Candidatus Omnitrophota bacterium]